MSDEPVAIIERVLVALRRSQSRRALHRRAAGAAGTRAPVVEAAGFQVLDAIEAAAEQGWAMTVNGIADALGVDQPRASRLVARAVGDGLVRRGADPADGRRSVLALTAKGERVLADGHRTRRDAIGAAVADWPPEDRETFARLLSAYLHDWERVVAETPGGGA